MTRSFKKYHGEEKELEEDTGMSKNTQFRAIQASASILSCVEDNFRGRRRLIELKRAGYNTDLSTPLDNIPFSTSSQRERIEENVCLFFALCDYVFVIYCNLSILMNLVIENGGTSDKPGLTQTSNFFEPGKVIGLDMALVMQRRSQGRN
ncbi:hypothetical protein SADUNF_Sadunf13G0121700 [Salix dunnii]|uniref:Uncharacterized protein n=1 Tax=Salix dunnii TaxID=1413687 RepID=A0A835MVC5_9ROSI|nr:hypothetical protein SADUNF_Sadunf13G0121700 [Salix dunnii]